MVVMMMMMTRKSDLDICIPNGDLNKADRHTSRAPSLQRPTDRPTNRQSGLQSRVHATKKEKRKFLHCYT